ncbi:3-oxoacyl-[acyl-carrier-protein] synthase III C-terminal domain-containing protein [Nonomuraea deserti]|uniref:3-oxoacyl-[acyl-carrier-protein] synthase III C-terminal domain-containing protein n=1 Tax=Nonomuraea deserti TaxID=1848322 RepID=UPI001C7017F1|nr:3-oxoacyl-[acyl-carrier-protein] synthase III C-terminal domain-containing protein [Nonomuraea deserti]
MAVHLPSQRVAVRSLQEELHLTDVQLKVYERFYGLSHILREPEGTVYDLLMAAAGELGTLHGLERRIRYVIQARTLPVATPYPTSAVQEVTRSLGLHRAQAFVVFHHACASGLLAVDIAGRLLERDGDPDALALVLTGEKTFTIAAKMVPDVAVNGEGAAAILVAPAGGRDQVLSYATRTHGRFSEGLTLSGEKLAEFGEMYPKALAEVMGEAADRAGLALTDIDLILPHNVNRVSWVRLCKLIGFPLDRVFLDNIPVTGHCFCADPFLNLRSACSRGRLKPGDTYLMAAVGLGATFSAMILKH